jgi:hypothetical protein
VFGRCEGGEERQHLGVKKSCNLNSEKRRME